MKLSSRFILDSLFVVAAAFLTVASMAWSSGTAGWTAFGVSAGVTVLAAASAVLAKKSSRRIGHGLLGVFALWSLIAALAFSGTTLTWLVFADAIALGVLALADLAVHEATTERIVHSLEVSNPAHDGRIAA
jgi:cytochrome b